MSPPSSCPSCSSIELEREDVNGHSQLLCTNCGFICDEVSFSNEDGGYIPPTGPISAALKSHVKASGDTRYSKSRCQWAYETKKICKVQGLPENMTKEIVALFETAYQHPTFLKKQNKQKLSGACLYVICRQNSWPILMKDIASTVQCHPSKLGAMVKLLKKEFHLEVPPQVVEHHVPNILNKVGLIDQSLQKKAEDIYNLASDTWLASGRQMDQVILAAGCLAWSSEQTKKQTTKSFVNILKGNVCGSSFYKRVSELRDVVVMLAKEIPWISKKHLKPESAQFLINDVLQHKKMLLAKFKPKNCGLDSAKVETENCFQPPAVRKNKGTSHDEPSCSYEHDLNSETLCDQDIPESNMHEYIYNPEEVEEREKILKDFRESDDDDRKKSDTEENVVEDKAGENVIDENNDLDEDCENGENNDLVENGDNIIGENTDLDENGDNICENKEDFLSSITENEDKAKSENRTDLTDEDVHPMQEIGSPNQLKRKAPLLPHSSSDESPSKKSRRFNRSRHIKISKPNITRLTRKNRRLPKTK